MDFGQDRLVQVCLDPGCEWQWLLVASCGRRRRRGNYEAGELSDPGVGVRKGATGRRILRASGNLR
jgi:hypothetical protein